MAQQLGVNGYVECKNILCDREVRPAERPTDRVFYCCHACGLAHLGDYPIGEGPLAHSDQCNQRQAINERKAEASWGDDTEPQPAGPPGDGCPHGYDLELETCDTCEPGSIRSPRQPFQPDSPTKEGQNMPPSKDE